MATIYTFSRNALLKRIGLSPGRKLFVFFISAVLITIPLPYAYNSIAVILFVLYSLLTAKKEDFSFNLALLLPLLLFFLMLLSLSWSIDFKSTLKALSKEASLLFIPLAFVFNRQLIKMGTGSILKNYSIGMCFFAVYYLGRAVVRYLETNNTDVFFYHELVSLEVNAIYVSALFSVALFYFLGRKEKSPLTYAALFLLLLSVFLLSSKTIFIIDIVLIACYFLFFSGMRKKIKVVVLGVFFAFVAIVAYYGKIGERLSAEYFPEGTQAGAGKASVVNIKQALTLDEFGQKAYFNGTAFRAYQARIFWEMLHEDPIFFTGYGLNASLGKIREKGDEHDVFKGNDENYGYSGLNFHNQYIEIFADLGIFGLILLIVMLFLNLKNSVKSKDFVHIAFAILMIALLLTESFLWRQRGVVFFITFYCLLNLTLKPAIIERKT